MIFLVSIEKYIFSFQTNFYLHQFIKKKFSTNSSLSCEWNKEKPLSEKKNFQNFFILFYEKFFIPFFLKFSKGDKIFHLCFLIF